MKKFEFEINITAPSQKDAVEKMKALNAIGKNLSLSDLQALAETVTDPVKLAYAKSQLGLK